MWAKPKHQEVASEQRAFEEVFGRLPKLRQSLRSSRGVLSGDEQQQLAIGPVLLTDPKPLLLDEPTEGIQFKRERRFAILLVEQGLHFTVRLTDPTLFLLIPYVMMAKGAVVAAGNAGDLSAELVRQHSVVV